MYNVLGSLNSILLEICQQTDLTAKSGSVAIVERILLLLDKTSFGTETSLGQRFDREKGMPPNVDWFAVAPLRSELCVLSLILVTYAAKHSKKWNEKGSGIEAPRLFIIVKYNISVVNFSENSTTILFWSSDRFFPKGLRDTRFYKLTVMISSVF